jgi:hypothetical protein
VVEDVHSNYWIKRVDSLETFIDLSKQMIDMMHEPYFDRKETEFRQDQSDALREPQRSYVSANLGGMIPSSYSSRKDAACQKTSYVSGLQLQKR